MLSIHLSTFFFVLLATIGRRLLLLGRARGGGLVGLVSGAGVTSGTSSMDAWPGWRMVRRQGRTRGGESRACRGDFGEDGVAAVL